uniref:Phosphoglycerate mutase n=1 Tax=Chrysotila carterae TaxID=13221 RepID=A0A7S4BFM1_CHRCT
MKFNAHEQMHGRTLSRRSLCYTLLAPAVIPMSPQLRTHAALASGLLRFDSSFSNAYILVRAGESLSDAAERIDTNPVNRDDVARGALTERGAQQVLDLARRLSELEFPLIWYSTACRSTRTAEMLGAALSLPRERLVPEYSFLDARGLGRLDGEPSAQTWASVHARDATDAFWRPPEGDDGTPNESVADVFARVRQLLSITETQYSQENIVIVSPDSEVLSTIAAAVCGSPLEMHSRFEMAPGEMRDLRLLQRDDGWRERRSLRACRAPADARDAAS